MAAVDLNFKASPGENERPRRATALANPTGDRIITPCFDPQSGRD